MHYSLRYEEMSSSGNITFDNINFDEIHRQLTQYLQPGIPRPCIVEGDAETHQPQEFGFISLMETDQTYQVRSLTLFGNQ